jgi:hypothetical protein
MGFQLNANSQSTPLPITNQDCQYRKTKFKNGDIQKRRATEDIGNGKEN